MSHWLTATVPKCYVELTKNKAYMWKLTESLKLMDFVKQT